MPLGILLAAAWLEMLTPAEIATEIGQSIDFLETDLRDVPERQRSMRAVFDYSWNLLTERERDAFQGLSVFRGGFTRQVAKEVAGASLRELMALVNKSLLWRDPGGRYGVHELLRQYAAERLGEAPAEEKAARDRHCTHYAGFLQGREADLIGRNQKQALAEIGAEIENVRAGWDWAVTQGRVEEMDRSLDSMAEFYHIRAWFQEGEETFARAARRLAEEQESAAALTGARAQEGIVDRESRTVLGKVLSQQGWFCSWLGLVEKSNELLQTSLAIFRDLGARREMAYALYDLGVNALIWETWEDGKPLLLEGLAIFKEIGDRRGIALSLGSLGQVAIVQGEYRTAKQLHQGSLTIFRELGNQRGIADSLDHLGYTTWALGKYGVAKQLHQESRALHEEIGGQYGIAGSLSLLAIDACGLGEYGEAKKLFRESLAIYKEIGISGEEGVLGDLGEVANVLGEYAEAIQLAQESLTLSKKLGDHDGIAWSLRVLGDATCGLEDFPGAKKHFHQALEIATTARMTDFAPLTLVEIARLLAAEGEKERALELLALVLHHPASWQWARDRAAPLVAELEAELSPDVVAAAQARGRARNLEATVAELLAKLGE